MSFIMKNYLLALCVGLSMGAGEAPAKDVELRCVSLVSTHPEGDVFLHVAGKKRRGAHLQVQGYLNHDSDTVALDGQDVIFTKDGSPKSVEDESMKLGQVKFPGNLERAILVFSPPKEEAPAFVSLIDDSAKAFPAGSYCVLNLSPHPVRIQLEGKDFDCPPDSQTPIVKPPVGEGNMIGMKAFYNKGGGDEWEQIASGIWPEPGRKRVLQIIQENPNGNGVLMKGLTDSAAP